MKVNQIQGSVEHALGYKVILCDLWGVIHNGKALFQHGVSFLEHMKENNIIWGVGRGSSVASYVLFLLGVHKIDSLQYNLNWREFLR